MLLPIKLICDRRSRKDGTNPVGIQYCYSSDQRTVLNTGISIPIRCPKAEESRLPLCPKRNVIENNVFVNVKKLYAGDAVADFGQQYFTATDPGFVDSVAMNFNLKTSSIVFDKLRSFKAVPFEKIGIQKKDFIER